MKKSIIAVTLITLIVCILVTITAMTVAHIVHNATAAAPSVHTATPMEKFEPAKYELLNMVEFKQYAEQTMLNSMRTSNLITFCQSKDNEVTWDGNSFVFKGWLRSTDPQGGNMTSLYWFTGTEKDGWMVDIKWGIQAVRQ